MSEFQLFPTTHWSLVARAGEDPSVAQRDALGDLLRKYLPAFRTYVISKYRIDRDRADDLVSGFVASRVVEKNLIGKAELGRGKFRNFLMTALERYSIDQFREESAQKRGGDRSGEDISEHADRLGDGEADPSAEFDAGWARQVVRQAIDRMRDATATTRPDLWGVFDDRVIGPAFDGDTPTAYDDLIRRLGFKDEGQAANALQTAKRIFSRILRGVVAEYAMTADEVDEEVGVLLSALGGR
ncbi:sigma-70 family RNA polymerase sigma factor [Humisphaera borealis]|uniref:Sigma-70 family RNA polymerase sigma factor n=1 Tax=Humisphaera borealis TaxID=2807512 RepID=A0A7M2WUS4_9BACT|nr:sigma-70 family RNA polymerase sigma factor [Humisphaera borealis]QOV89044.1 sigma-70 family RNA polymerase sigma factor [Humisphaera borealis]